MFPGDIVELYEQCRKLAPSFQISVEDIPYAGRCVSAKATVNGLEFQWGNQIHRRGRSLTNEQCLQKLRELLAACLQNLPVFVERAYIMS